MFDLADKYQDPKFLEPIYQSIINYYRLTNQILEEASVFKELTDRINNNPTILNQYAWRMTELKLSLEDALIKSTLAVRSLLTALTKYSNCKRQTHTTTY